MTTVSQLADAFQAIFGNAYQIAQDTGFVQRVQKGKLTGKRFAVTQTLGLLVSGGGAMSDLAYFGTHVGAHVSPQALDQRFGETTANFLKELLNRRSCRRKLGKRPRTAGCKWERPDASQHA
jgi:hypothetical protein